jgi:hypothetical protein
MMECSWDFAALVDLEAIRFRRIEEIVRFLNVLDQELGVPPTDAHNLVVTAITGEQRRIPYGPAAIGPMRIWGVGEVLRLAIGPERSEVVMIWPHGAGVQTAGYLAAAFDLGATGFGSWKAVLLDGSSRRPAGERVQALSPQRFPLVDAVALELSDVRAFPGTPPSYQAWWEISGLGVRIRLAPPAGSLKEHLARLRCAEEGSTYEDVDQGYRLEVGRWGDSVWVLWGAGPDEPPWDCLPEPAYHTWFRVPYARYRAVIDAVEGRWRQVGTL